MDADRRLSFSDHLLFLMEHLERKLDALCRWSHSEFPLLRHFYGAQRCRAGELETADRSDLQKLYIHRDDLAVDFRLHGSNFLMEFV